MYTVSRLIITKKEAEDYIHDYEEFRENQPFVFEKEPLPWDWDKYSLQSKVDFIFLEGDWFQYMDFSRDFLEGWRGVEVLQE